MNLLKAYLNYYLELHDRYLQAGRIYRHAKYGLVFKTTNYCWYQCPHCCESSGPNNPRIFMPADTICDYLTQAHADARFNNNVVFTGGEIMSSYRFGDDDYVPRLLNHSLDLGISTDIKTNAAWIRAGFGDKIIQDLADVTSRHKPYSLQISLSLDTFHKNALENNARVISSLAQECDTQLCVHVSEFSGKKSMLPDLLARVRQLGTGVEEVFLTPGGGCKKIRILHRAGNVLIIPSTGNLFAGGRAASMPDAAQDKFARFRFLYPDGSVVTAFDSAGNVTLGENWGRRISTPWKARNGNIPLDRIRVKMLRKVWNEELYARLFSGWRCK